MLRTNQRLTQSFDKINKQTFKKNKCNSSSFVLTILLRPSLSWMSSSSIES
ncbi:hypothetical protein [Mycoplasmoides gallisepticum]|uniref:hypothetical protein n=1 Tax=Mycoplasmoides gallisepticum TaxID=2096 RepID=UPI003357171C